ncbi:MAG: chorismate mutase [Acholeplasmataceae bacterium]|nr:chorismate mutase [Acholeplasmataceae bacterium]MCK9233575.1 chorismate mutase [Acholeplasmataceae bacterium]MCK9288781.1 chorismate mutase [Acholeplasmataceae bacterium]MCK9427313.1 chorismate mutase [Acholeplasmataceae bacterium]HHT39707.1 chorismate mutase [Acholeplasmataceae bacterium]
MLHKKRNKIEKIDRKLAYYFNKRFQVIADLKELKKINDLPLEDSKREQDLINKMIPLIDEDKKDYFIEVYKMIFKLSKAYQK